MPWSSLLAGLLVAGSVILMPLFSGQHDESRMNRQLQVAFLLRQPQSYNRQLEKVETAHRSSLATARQLFLKQEFVECLAVLRQPLGMSELSSDKDSLDTEDEVKALRSECRLRLLHDLPWPKKLTVGLATELDGEKDAVLFAVIDSCTGPDAHDFELSVRGWRSDTYKPLEAEDFNSDGHPGRKESHPIDSPQALQSVTLQRPKDAGMGQVLFTYLSRRNYLAEIYLMRDGHLRRYRWKSSKAITVSKDSLRVYNPDLQKYQEWSLRGDKWSVELPGS